MATSSINQYVGRYTQMKTLPALLSVVFITFGAFAFGAIEPITFNWFDYTFKSGDSVLITLGVYALAFASSETRRFENYDDWEQALVVAGPAVVIIYQYLPGVFDHLINTFGDPLSHQLAFVLTLVSWSVATQ